MASSMNREWIAAEFSKGIDAEQASADEARGRADSPPDPTLGVLYHEIATADDRHRVIVETVATRYGHTPSRGLGGGIGESLGRLRDKVTDKVMGTGKPMERVAHDLAVKANAIHWYTAWVHAFEALGDAESARELSAVLTEESSHRDALQLGLNRLVQQGAGAVAATASTP